MHSKLINLFMKKVPWQAVLLVLLLAIALLNYSYLPLKNVYETNMETQEKRPVQVYYKDKSEREKRFLFEGTIEHRPSVRERVRLAVIKDDCLESLKINGREVPLGKDAAQCSPFMPSYIDATDYLTQPVNHFEAEVRNVVGIYSFEIFATYQRLHLFAKVLCSGVLLWAIHQLLLRVERSKKIRISTLFCFLVAYFYFLYTPYYARVMDMLGHIENVIHIVRFHEWLKPFDGWQSHHPFFYYTFAALSYAAVEPISQFPLQSYLGVFSLLFLLFYLIMQGKLIKLLLPKKRRMVVMLASGLVPMLVFSSVMIGNSMACLSMNMAMMYFLVRWYQKGKPKDFIWVCVFCILGLVTRTSSVLMLVALLASVVGRKYFSSGKALFPKRSRRMAIGFLCLAVATFPATVADNIYYSIQKNRGTVLFSNGPALTRSHPFLIVRNDLISYIGFDVKDHLTRPFVGRVQEGEPMREYYWNYMLKSALVGEWDYWLKESARPWVEWLARGMAAVQLMIVALFLAGFFSQTKTDIRKNFPLIMILVASIAASMGFRVSYPVIGNGDIRYIVFIMVPVYYFVLQSPRFLSKRGKRIFRQVGTLSMAAFILFSLSFFVSLAWA